MIVRDTYTGSGFANSLSFENGLQSNGMLVLKMSCLLKLIKRCSWGIMDWWPKHLGSKMSKKWDGINVSSYLSPFTFTVEEFSDFFFDINKVIPWCLNTKPVALASKGWLNHRAAKTPHWGMLIYCMSNPPVLYHIFTSTPHTD